MRLSTTLIIAFFLLGGFTSAQTLKESIKLIKKKSDGNEIFLYNEKAQKVSLTLILHVSTFVSQTVNTFDSQSVVSLNRIKNQDGKYYIRLNFIDNGANVHSCNKGLDDLLSNCYTSLRYILDLPTKVNSKNIDEYVIAYINLFKEIGVNVNDLGEIVL